MYARITKDVINVGDDLVQSRAGRTIINGAHETLLDVRLLDDDRIVYYYAIADDGALEMLFEWGARDAGTAIMQQKDAHGKWVDVIG